MAIRSIFFDFFFALQELKMGVHKRMVDIDKGDFFDLGGRRI